MLEIYKEFYYVKFSSELLFHNEESVVHWLVDNVKQLQDIKVFIINTEKWTVTEVPDKWWLQVALESTRRKKCTFRS